MLALREQKKLIELLNSGLTADGLQILIGSETDFTQVHNFSLVARRYGSHAPLGMLRIIGPMRMEYARMAPLVDYLSRALSRKIADEQEQQQKWQPLNDPARPTPTTIPTSRKIQ